MNILVLNGGSSSLKASLFEVNAPIPSHPPEEIWKGLAEWGRDQGKGSLRSDFQGKRHDEAIASTSLEEIANSLLRLFAKQVSAGGNARSIDAVGHRIVFGGKRLRHTCLLTPEVTEEIGRLSEFAPEHNPLAVATIRSVARLLGSAMKQVAVFDTAFHATMPPEAAIYPIPYAFTEEGIERLGFHGISHAYLARRAAEILSVPLESLRIVTCHLGNGCSLAAVRAGRSVDTTMGFTPMEGLMMGTRSGTVDPGILLHLLRKAGNNVEKIDRMLNEESGLKGVSGISGDMRSILEAVGHGNQRAKLAYETFLHRLCRGIGSMIGSLGGIDALVFGGGIGENTPGLRKFVAERFQFLGLMVDETKNSGMGKDARLSTEDSKVAVLVVHTEEDWEIARECYGLTSAGGGEPHPAHQQNS